MKNLFEQFKKGIELRKQLKETRNSLHEHQTKMDSINEELDLIGEGKLHADDTHIGTLLQRKLLIQRDICYAVETIVNIERELKGLF